jgi:hypothetical protein
MGRNARLHVRLEFTPTTLSIGELPAGSWVHGIVYPDIGEGDTHVPEAIVQEALLHNEVSVTVAPDKSIVWAGGVKGN